MKINPVFSKENCFGEVIETSTFQNEIEVWQKSKTPKLASFVLIESKNPIFCIVVEVLEKFFDQSYKPQALMLERESLKIEYPHIESLSAKIVKTEVLGFLEAEKSSLVFQQPRDISKIHSFSMPVEKAFFRNEYDIEKVIEKIFSISIEERLFETILINAYLELKTLEFFKKSSFEEKILSKIFRLYKQREKNSLIKIKNFFSKIENLENL